MRRQRPVRRAAAALWLLLAVPCILLMIVFLAFDARTTLDAEGYRYAADVSALAGARELAGDDLLRSRLTGTDAGLGPVFGRAFEAARASGELNPVAGSPLSLDPNPDNERDGTFVVGRVARPVFPAEFEFLKAPEWHQANAVRIEVVGGRKNGPRMICTAFAMLDGRVTGFRPLHPGQTLPVVPVALDADTWERGVTAWRATATDLPEIEFCLRAAPRAADEKGGLPTAVALTIGASSPAELANQIARGVSDEEYKVFFARSGGPFETDRRGGLRVPGDQYYGATHATLRKALECLQKSGETRAWPLCPDLANTPAGVTPVTGFVAGRVVCVAEDTKGESAALRVTVRAAMLDTPTAVTRPKAPENPYVGRLRLVTAESRDPE